MSNQRNVADSTVRDYIERLGQRLAEGTRILRFPLTFKVVDSTELNALSLPGGFIYINTGTILAAENEAALASVIAHQIGHLAAGHGVELASKLEGSTRATCRAQFHLDSPTWKLSEEVNRNPSGQVA